jgi:hypothetical protein
LLVGKICVHIFLKKGPKIAIFIETKSNQLFSFLWSNPSNTLHITVGRGQVRHLPAK